MSQILHAFKVPIQSKWKFADACRKKVLKHWKPVFENGASKIKQMDFIHEHAKEYEYSLQFFEPTPFAEFNGLYLVRIRSSNYLLENYLWGIKHPSFNIDTRVQSISAHRQQIVDYIEKLIDTRHYFVIPIVTEDDYVNIILNAKTTKEQSSEKKPARSRTKTDAVSISNP